MSDTYGRGKTRGWILYDANCSFCLGLLERARPQIDAAGLLAAPLQADWVRERLRLPDDQLLAEMKLLLPTGQIYGGAAAAFKLARLIPRAARPAWAWGFVLCARLPFAHPLARAIYRFVATRRYCRGGKCAIPATSTGGVTCAR